MSLFSYSFFSCEFEIKKYQKQHKICLISKLEFFEYDRIVFNKSSQFSPKRHETFIIPRVTPEP